MVFRQNDISYSMTYLYSTNNGSVNSLYNYSIYIPLSTIKKIHQGIGVKSIELLHNNIHECVTYRRYSDPNPSRLTYNVLFKWSGYIGNVENNQQIIYEYGTDRILVAQVIKKENLFWFALSMFLETEHYKQLVTFLVDEDFITDKKFKRAKQQFFNEDIDIPIKYMQPGTIKDFIFTSGEIKEKNLVKKKKVMKEIIKKIVEENGKGIKK